MAKFGQGRAKTTQGGAKKILRASRANKTRFALEFFVPINLAPPWLKSCSRPWRERERQRQRQTEREEERKRE